MNSVGSLDATALLARAHDVADSSGNVIITFCDSAYREFLLNWLAAISRHGKLPLLIFALDDELDYHLRQDGVPVVRAHCDGRSHNLWALRTKAIHAIVAGGLNVTHSDVDAVWIKDPLPLLNGIDADIVSSQGTTYPRVCFDKWGHVLCFGFIHFRASDATIELLAQAAARIERDNHFDDQYQLNKKLLARGIEWSARLPYKIPFQDVQLTCSCEPIFGVCRVRSGPLRVAVLPHAQVQRISNGIEDPEAVYVSHPLSPKGSAERIGVLQAQGAWFVEVPSE